MGISVPVLCLSEKQAKEAHYAKMSAIANLLVSPTPRGLLDVLSDFSFDVRSNDSIYEIWPTRDEMRALLSQAGQLAFELSSVLQNGPMTAFLAQNSKFGSEDRIKNLTAELFELLRHAAEARKSPLLIGDDGYLLSGAGKPLLSGDMPPKFLCAAIIAEVISFLVGRGSPPPSQKNTRMAAHLYWTALPQGEEKRQGWGSDPQKGWQRYFDAANDERLYPLRQEVRRHLTIRSRDGI